MAIDVEWQDENGETELRYVGPPIDSRLRDAAPENSCCLRFLDPYGDATFNSYQVEMLERELELVAGANAKKEVVQQARELLKFVREVQDRVHMYLKFIGD